MNFDKLTFDDKPGTLTVTQMIILIEDQYRPTRLLSKLPVAEQVKIFFRSKISHVQHIRQLSDSPNDLNDEDIIDWFIDTHVATWNDTRANRERELMQFLCDGAIELPVELPVQPIRASDIYIKMRSWLNDLEYRGDNETEAMIQNMIQNMRAQFREVCIMYHHEHPSIIEDMRKLHENPNELTNEAVLEWFITHRGPGKHFDVPLPMANERLSADVVKECIKTWRMVNRYYDKSFAECVREYFEEHPDDIRHLRLIAESFGEYILNDKGVLEWFIWTFILENRILELTLDDDPATESMIRDFRKWIHDHRDTPNANLKMYFDHNPKQESKMKAVAKKYGYREYEVLKDWLLIQCPRIIPEEAAEAQVEPNNENPPMIQDELVAKAQPKIEDNLEEPEETHEKDETESEASGSVSEEKSLDNVKTEALIERKILHPSTSLEEPKEKHEKDVAEKEEKFLTDEQILINIKWHKEQKQKEEELKRKNAAKIRIAHMVEDCSLSDPGESSSSEVENFDDSGSSGLPSVLVENLEVTEDDLQD